MLDALNMPCGSGDRSALSITRIRHAIHVDRAGLRCKEAGVRPSRLRLMIFASVPDHAERAVQTIGLGHIVEFLQGYLRKHWEPLRTAQLSDPVFGFLATLEKAARGRAAKD